MRFFKISTLLVLLFIVGFQKNSTAEESYIEPSSNLFIDGIPHIPKSIASEIGRYSEFRSAVFQDWHPEKKELLILTRFGDTYQVHEVKVPGGYRKQLTFSSEHVLYKDNMSSSATYSPNGKSFLYNMSEGGNEQNQIYLYDFESGKNWLVTDGKSKNSSPVWSSDKKQITYASNRRSPADTDVYITDPYSPNVEKLVIQLKGGGWSILDWSPDGKSLLLEEYVSVTETYLWLLNIEKGEKNLLTPKPKKEKVTYAGGLFDKEGKGFYTTTDLNSEFNRLAYYSFATKQFKPLTEGINWDIEDVSISDNAKWIAFLSNEDGVSVLHILDTATNKEIKLPKLPSAGTISGIKWHNNSTDLAFNFSSNKSPNDVWSYSVSSNQFERWTYSETAGLVTEMFSDPEIIRWKSFDGKQIPALLYRPPSHFTGKRPVIVNIHGGPEAQSRPSFLGATNYYINELGLAVIYPNIRGSTGYGKTYTNLDNGLKRLDAHKDIDTLLDWIATQPDLDSNRIMVMGGSYGGYMTLVSATNYSDKIRCAVDVVGPSNLVTFLKNTADYRRDLRRVEYGDERDPKMNAFLEKNAPLNLVKQIKKPLFVIQGQNDPRVPHTEAEQIVSAVKKNNTPVWYLMAKDEGHGFTKKKNTDFQIYSVVYFMKNYLLNE